MNKKPSNNMLRSKECYFCINGIKDIDYKDTRVLQKFLSGYAKIMSRRRNGLCYKHQRKFTMAVKRARVMALIPFVNK